ncbi:MAG: hypothetical protein IPH65_02325 [Dehalococcoidia bacterium]|nr:hypothetical protein [Dehalococcoidia bacterium]
MERIRAHLVENLSIQRTDFDELPIFARHGGWAPANRVFDGTLATFLQDLNEAIAA